MYYKLIVNGKVQGVGYRYFVYHLANSMSAKGYVKNLRDGSVEIIIDEKSISDDFFINKLKEGPIRSRVVNIEQSIINIERNYEEFHIF